MPDRRAMLGLPPSVPVPSRLTAAGFVCPWCGASRGHVVVDSRATRDHIRRRRVCMHCNRRFTTNEVAVSDVACLIRSPGGIEPFDPQRLRSALWRAIAKSPHVRIADVETFIARIEEQARPPEPPLEVARLRHQVLEWLRARDRCAELRFLSDRVGFEMREWLQHAARLS
jgi:transcriptional repressor NrdR